MLNKLRIMLTKYSGNFSYKNAKTLMWVARTKKAFQVEKRKEYASQSR